jgi:hypothetical protein
MKQGRTPLWVLELLDDREQAARDAEPAPTTPDDVPRWVLDRFYTEGYDHDVEYAEAA